MNLTTIDGFHHTKTETSLLFWFSHISRIFDGLGIGNAASPDPSVSRELGRFSNTCICGSQTGHIWGICTCNDVKQLQVSPNGNDKFGILEGLRTCSDSCWSNMRTSNAWKPTTCDSSEPPAVVAGAARIPKGLNRAAARL